MTPVEKLTLCLAANTAILVTIVTLATIFASDYAFWRVGPSKEFIVVSVTIDTWGRYIFLLLLLALVQVSRVIVEEIAMPILGFSVYNPDKKHVKEFTKNQLQFFANSMFMVSGIRGIFMIMVTVSQIDVALFSLLAGEIASVFAIRMLLNTKKFGKLKANSSTDDDAEKGLLPKCPTSTNSSDEEEMIH